MKYNDKHEVTLGQASQLSPAADAPPRISSAVAMAPAGTEERFKTKMEKDATTFTFGGAASFAGDVKALLGHLLERLIMGLEEAWISTYGYDGPLPLPAKETDPLSDTELEEMWARIFAEMFVFAAYGGTSMVYERKNSNNEDMLYYKRMDPAGNTDPMFPIMAACQHIATFGGMTRGILVDKFEPNGMTAGAGTKGLAVWKEKDASWFEASSEVPKTVKKKKKKKEGDKEVEVEEPSTGNQENYKYRKLDHLISTCKLTPGSVFAFNSLGPKATSQEGAAHIGSAIRIFGGDSIQAMDTGVLATGADGGTLDHGLMKKQLTGMPGNLVGVGVLPTKTLTKEQCDFLRTARPAGFAQLMLADDNKDVRYLSRLLPMNHLKHNFAPARYYWSLRDLPATGLWAFWILYIPAVPAVSEALRQHGARDKTPSQIIEEGLAPAVEKAKKAGKTPPPAKLSGLMNPVIVLGSTPYGRVILHRRKQDGPKDEWDGHARKESLFPPDMKDFKLPNGKLFSDSWGEFLANTEYSWPDTKGQPSLNAVSADLEYWNGNGATATVAAPASASKGPSGAPPASSPAPADSSPPDSTKPEQPTSPGAPPADKKQD